MRGICLFIMSVLCYCSSIIAQKTSNQSPLTIEQIMQGPRFVGYLPDGIYWSEDSQWIYFDWNPEMDTLTSLYKVNVNGGVPEKVSEEEIKSMPSFDDFNEKNTQLVYEKNGDLFLKDLPKGETLQITNTLKEEYDPIFSGDEKSVIFEKEDNLFRWDRENGTITQLTNFQEGHQRPKRSKSRHEEWLKNDQLTWFETLQWREAQTEARKNRREARKVERLKPFYIGDKNISNLNISPTGAFVTFRLTDRVNALRTEVPNFVTKSGQVEDLRARPKVGFPQDRYEFGICDLVLDTCFLVDTKQIEGIFDKPAFLKNYHTDSLPFEEKYRSPREVIIHGATFSKDGKAVVDIKAMDNKDRWIMLLDLPTGDLKLLDRQHDDAWIGGPGISSWNFSSGNMGWLPDDQHIYFQSEESGYSHLYTINVETGKKKALTSGSFEILEAYLSEDETQFYITSNKETPFEQHFYTLPIKGGKMTKLTSRSGNHQVTLSPDEKWLAIRYSYSNKPWELYLMPNKAGTEMQQLTNSTTDAFENYDWRLPEMVWFDASDGVKVPARLYQPKTTERNGAAVIFVHGAGYLQNVHSWWSSYYREFMFHNILLDNGYTVLDIDYRASSGYGRDWRTAIYQHMGGKDLSDQVDGAKYLTEVHNIDANRIGIYGGSYGGFITLMALFTSPGTFKSGAALRSVTDWAHYNHPYTSNILNTPVEDSLAYYRSSPIYHAEGLQDHLLILHGMIDTNVQFQDVVRLAQRLIELGKENWEFAVFPLERHGFIEPSSWTDEYRRIFKLFQDTLRE